jgi:D-alanyl-D-alanine carboxypeptidase
MKRRTLHKKFNVLAVLLLLLKAALLFPVSASPIRSPEYIAGAVNVMCAETGLVLYEYNQHERHYPASITKVMTALLVLEHVTDLGEVVVISENAANLPWYAASMGLRAGDSLTVWEALHGILLPSANEVARALAEHVAGCVGVFVELMNERAWELGAVNTHYVNPCGLPGDGQHITAYDMSLIMRQAIRNPVFVEIINTESFTFPPSQRHPDERTLRNTNRLIRQGDDFYNKLVVGGKTGWIIAARNTLTTYSVQDNRGLIVTVLYTDGSAATFADTISLLSHGFTLLDRMPLPVIVTERTGESVPVSAPGVIVLPGIANETVIIQPEEAAATTPNASPLERMARFALLLAQVLAAVTIIAGGGVIILLVRKRREKHKWTFFSKTSP